MSEDSYVDALRQGMHEIPIPTASRDFDARVLSAVGRREPGWRILVDALRPAFGGAAIALPIMFWLIASAQESTIVRSSPLRDQATTQQISESALDSPTLTPLSFRRATIVPATLIKKNPLPDRSGQRDLPAIVS